MLRTAARLLVEDHIGGTLSDIDVIDWGNEKRIAVVHFEDEPSVVVCQNSTVLSGALISECMRKTGPVPVPEVLWCDPTGEETTFPTYIQRYVDGSFLPRTPEAYREAGCTLARLHNETPSEHAGTVEYEEGELTVNTQSWPEGFKQVLNRVQNMTTKEVPQHVVDSVEAYVSDNDHLLENRPTALCHQDMHPHNIIAEGSEIKAVIDWDRAEYQDPEADLALAEYLTCDAYVEKEDERAQLRAAFYKGYQSTRPISEEYFAGRRSLYRLPSLVWAVFNDLPPSRDHPTDRIHEELMMLLDET